MFNYRAWQTAFVGTLVAVAATSALADEGRLEVQQAIHQAAGSPQLVIGAPQTEDIVRQLVAAAEQVGGPDGAGIIPAGTTVDHVSWDGALLDVDLTFAGARADWQLSTIDMSTFSQSLGTPFMHDSAFAGVRVRARRDASSAYGSLMQFVPTSAAPPEVDDADTNADARIVTSVEGPRIGRFGGSTSSNRQPIGPLTGVTLYCSGGHGWTAPDPDSGDWYLQRPVAQGMNEDHGNLDQLNYLVHFARNAGATVVPMRPVGWQPLEVVLDNDDPGVTYTGAWTDSGGSKYFENGATVSGVPYRFATAAAIESATARFSANITVSDYYPVYAFAIASANRVRQTYRVGHSGGVTETVVDHRDVGNGWVWLGEYYFEAGGTAYVEVTNESPDSGVVVADAVRWGSGMGDIVRPGAGTVSGYPRDEECSRYWAESQLGNNAVGFSSSIWDTSSSDQNDNVGTGARTGREMNQVPAGGVQVDRWKRIYLECHTNATDGTVRGQICLITTSGSTTYQSQYATTLSNEIDAEMTLLDSDFEHSWFDRSSPTYTSAYGAISTPNNGDEFDATIAELAFHDNTEDAELLRDPRVRRALARACVHGIIRFLNTLPGSQVTLDFAPDTPSKLRVEDLGGGDVRISWQAPVSDQAHGDPATGYVIYQSDNGFGFGNPIDVGNVTSYTISGVPTGETHYYRVAATNDGGESMPTETLAVRRPASGTATVLVVNGFDRLRRTNNRIETFTQPTAYAGLSIERQQWRRSNAFNYIVEHAEALAANDIGFASSSNEAVADLTVDLNNYEIVDWILGTESTDDETFNLSEQTRVSDFLNNGGALFASGSEIAYDLVNQGGGVSFAQNTLRVNYAADDAGTYDATGAAGGILSDIAGFDFDIANGAAYNVTSPDRLVAGTDAAACLNYVGGSGGTAGVQYTGPVYNTVVFGFPFETITSASVRADIMLRVINFLETAAGPLQFDFNNDGRVDNSDFNIFRFCFQGPDTTYAPGHICLDMDGDFDFDVDVDDFALFQAAFTGP